MADRDQDYGAHSGEHDFRRDRDRNEPGRYAHDEDRSWRGRSGSSTYGQGATGGIASERDDQRLGSHGGYGQTWGRGDTYRDVRGREDFGQYGQTGSGARFTSEPGREERGYSGGGLGALGGYGGQYARGGPRGFGYGGGQFSQGGYGTYGEPGYRGGSGFGQGGYPSYGQGGYGSFSRGEGSWGQNRGGGWGGGFGARSASDSYDRPGAEHDRSFHAQGYEPGAQIWRNDTPQMGGGRQVEPHSPYGDFEPDYLHWRESQMQNFDRDYHSWRQERRSKFAKDFDDWRSQRSRQQGQGGLFDQGRDDQTTQGAQAGGQSQTSAGYETGREPGSGQLGIAQTSPQVQAASEGHSASDKSRDDKARDDRSNIKKI